jgi:uncharacterized coiled-coil protein SlyX
MTDKTLDQLDAKIAAKNAAVDKLKDELRPLTRERDAFIAREATAKKLASMSPAEREAMKAALG